MSLYQTVVFVLMPAWASEEARAGLALLSPEHSLGLQLTPEKRACSFTRPLPLIWGYDGIIDLPRFLCVLTVSWKVGLI